MIYTHKGIRYNLKTGTISKVFTLKPVKKKLIKWEILVSFCYGKDYYYFLKSKYWKEIRKIILRRDKYKCTVCNSTRDLNIHHTTYKHHFNEHKHLNELITVCERCHTNYHLIKDI